MIDLKDLRENPDKYRRAAQLKRIAIDVDRVLHLEADRIRHQQEFERLRAEQNESSRQIGRAEGPDRETGRHRAGGAN